MAGVPLNFIPVPIKIVAVFIVSVVVSAKLPTESYVISQRKIYALQDNFSTKGTFILASGSFQKTMQYTYLVEQDNGFVMEQINTYNIIIVEDDSNQPQIVRYGTKLVNEKNNKWIWQLGPHKYDCIKIYIPKNSVRYNYEIDLN